MAQQQQQPSTNTSSSSKVSAVMKKHSQIIPEASERDELTVQEMSEARDTGIKYPLSPKQAAKSYGQFLTESEMTEI